MKHAGTVFLVVMLFSTLGLWGLAQQKNGAYASRLRDLEARHSRVEDDQRAMINQSEKNQRRIAQLEVEKADLSSAVTELKAALAELDSLKADLAARTQERDAAKAQLASRTKEANDLRQQLQMRTQERDQATQDLKQFATDLQALMGRVDNAIARVNRPGVVEATPTSRRPE